jgi:hypothetical protein
MLKAVNPENEWQEWAGGKHPDISRDALTAVEFRDGKKMGPRRAARWEWEHNPRHPDDDIVAFLLM